MAKYKVLAEVEVLGEMRAVGSELEIDAETATPLIADGKLEEVKEETPNTASQPQTPQEPGVTPSGNEKSSPASEPAKPEPAPEKTAAAASPEAPKAEESKGWAGNHTVDRPGDK